MRKLLLIFIFLTFNLSSKSQNIQRISPSNLIVSDTMTVDILTSLPFLVGNEPPWYCGELISIYDTTSNNIITIDILLNLTGVKSPAACSRVDTAKIVLPSVPGNYELKCFVSSIDTINSIYNATRVLRDSTMINVGSPIGIEELNNIESVRISPNPSSNKLTVEGFAEGEFDIYNNEGKLVQDGTFKKSIDISTLSEGLYFLVLDQRHILKFVVDR